MKIYKYELDPNVVARIGGVFMSSGAIPLHIGVQDGRVFLWAMVDPDKTECLIEIQIVGTGHEVPKDVGDYIGTAIVAPFVWHFFKLTSIFETLTPPASFDPNRVDPRGPGRMAL